MPLRSTIVRLSALAPTPRIVRLRARGRRRGRALLSYLRSARWHDRDPRLRGHSNKWESRQIARTLASRGFAVDVVEFDDRQIRPRGRYDVVMAIDGEVVRLAETAGDPIMLLHQTGAFASFQNAAEQRRIEELEARRGVRCAPRRLVGDVEGAIAALRAADACSLIGNAWTRGTFPAELRPKITCVPVSATVPTVVRDLDTIARAGRGFLWFFGSGAVHKGLDRVLEAFAREPSLELHVVGNVADEHDFIEAYRHELFALPNIHWHGPLDPGGVDFGHVLARCSFAVAPSCSEGTSPATATALKAGLYPLVSRATGIDLPDGCGRYLESCTVEEITDAAREAAALSGDELLRQIARVQRHTVETYSRPAFAAAMEAYLAGVLDG